jgi:two-component system, chemotaxis family, CheB/CheR fusion protein
MNLQQFERQVGALRDQVAMLWPPADQPGTPLPPPIGDAFAALAHALEELQSADTEIRQQNEELAGKQDALEAASQHWRDLFDLAPDGYLVTDLLGIVLEANQAAARLFDTPQAELVGMPLAVLVTSEARRGFLTTLATPPRSREKQVIEMRLKPRRGPLLIADVTVARMTAMKPDRVELTWLIHDVTERRKTEQALRQAHDELELHVQERTAELEASRHQAQTLARRLVEIQETERTAIAREIHDQAGQDLSALILGLGVIQKEAGELEAIATHAAELQQIADGTMDGLHRLAMRLHPTSLDRAGLAGALAQHIETFRQHYPLDVEMVLLGLENERLPGEVEITVYRVVQESLTNVVRHARARKVGVIVERQGDRVKAIIEDDGLGFDVEEALRCGRLGLLGMRERVEMLDGHFAIESAPGKGTTVFADLPSVC